MSQQACPVPQGLLRRGAQEARGKGSSESRRLWTLHSLRPRPRLRSFSGSASEPRGLLTPPLGSVAAVRAGPQSKLGAAGLRAHGCAHRGSARRPEAQRPGLGAAVFEEFLEVWGQLHFPFLC